MFFHVLYQFEFTCSPCWPFWDGSSWSLKLRSIVLVVKLLINGRSLVCITPKKGDQVLLIMIKREVSKYF